MLQDHPEGCHKIQDKYKKISKDKPCLIVSHPYATCPKGEPPTPSLSTTAGMGSGGLRKAQTQEF